jgi:site-specific DNA recombinase
MKGAVIYCRVSTKEQTQNLSLPTQLRNCREYCERQALQVLKEFTDRGESAKTTDRPEFQELLRFCEEHRDRVNFVVVYNLSRFTRNAQDYALLLVALTRLGITVQSVNEQVSEGAVGKFTANMLVAVAQLENDAKSERTIAGMRAAIDVGKWPFQAPIGYLTGGRGRPSLVLDEARAPLVREAFELFATGSYSKRDVVRRLAARGLCTRAGRPVSPQTLGAVLRNEVYAGRIWVPTWNLRTTGDFEPLVSEDVFDRVQRILTRRSRTITPYERNHEDFPLRRFVSCAACTTPLTGSWSTGRGRKYAYYHCRCERCRTVKVQKRVLEEKFVELLETLQPETAYLRLFNAVVLDVWRQRDADGRRLRQTLSGRIASLQARLGRVEDAFLHERAIDRRTFESQRDRLRAEISTIETEMPDSALEAADVEDVLAFAEHVLSDTSRVWSDSGLNQKQCLQQVLFPTGLAFDGERFGTAATCLAFRHLEGNGEGGSSVASPTGFEPVSWP